MGKEGARAGITGEELAFQHEAGIALEKGLKQARFLGC